MFGEEGSIQNDHRRLEQPGSINMVKMLRAERVSMDKEHNHRGYSVAKLGTIGETIEIVELIIIQSICVNKSILKLVND